MYFLVVALSQLIPSLRVGYLFTYIAPLAFVLSVTLLKEAWDDFARYRRDHVLIAFLLFSLIYFMLGSKLGAVYDSQRRWQHVTSSIIIAARRRLCCCRAQSARSG